MLKDVVTNKAALFSDGCQSELRCQKNTKRTVALLSGNLTANSRTEESGVCARVYKNGVYGFSSMAEVSDSAAESVLRAATENADFLAGKVGKNAPELPKITAEPYFTDYAVSDTEQKLYIDFARELDSYIEKKYPDLSGRGVRIYCDSMEKYISTSGASSGHTVLPRSYIYLRMSTQTKDGSPIERFCPIGDFGSFFENFSTPDKVYPEIDALYEKIMKKREGIYPEAGLKTCILGGVLSGMLSHEAVGHTVEADLVLGGSVAAHSLGREVASPLVTMVDFAHTFDNKPVPLPVYLDDEGVPASDEVLIKDGILTGYMNSRETAQRFGMVPRGSARAYSFSDEPLIRMRNTAILPGNSTLEEMIASVEDGYYFTDTNNGQADTTGEFMFGVCMGYEIKHGKIGRALLDTTISGVAFDMLKTVDMVSDTMVWESCGFCGKKQPMPVGMGGPALRCKVTVGGR